MALLTGARQHHQSPESPPWFVRVSAPPRRSLRRTILSLPFSPTGSPPGFDTAPVSLYLILKFVHVLLAIIAIGFNASYPIWLARAQREPEHALYVLRGIKTLDDRFANPAYALLLVLGLAMTFMAGIPLSTFWIASALVLYVVLVLVALLVYSPT